MNLLLLLAATSLSAATVSAFNINVYNNIKHVHPSIHRKYNHALSRKGQSFKRIGSSRIPIVSIQSTNTNEATSLTSSLSASDIHHMKLAMQTARIGAGNTYPNPAVGCVLVRHNEDSLEIIGSGFHPKAGMPHAEVFALLEACGHVDNGVEAARSVMDLMVPATPLATEVLELLNVYKSSDGANKLFGDKLSKFNITAYVTLEPCCHVGQTPPCALSLVAAEINRVVVGFRDPNLRVDGGGIQILQEAGIEVHVMSASSNYNDEKEAALECAQLVEYFVKRISPDNGFSSNMYANMTGKKKRLLRAMALRQKTDGIMPSVEWPLQKGNLIHDSTDIDSLNEISIDNRFIERVDQLLFDHEVVLLRLTNVVKKKKGAKIIGDRVAQITNAYVAQVLGHTALLYRPATPPIIDLDELLQKDLDE